jgi:RNA polymerase sigma-70 factor, ECF subfamily
VAKPPEKAHQPESEPDSFETIYARCYRKVVYYFLHRGIPAEDARDLAQETFLRAHRGWQEFRRQSSSETWLYKIAENIFKNWIRDRRALKKQGTEISLTANPDSEETSLEAVLPDDGPGADLKAIESENLEMLRELVGKLPPQRQICLQLRLRDLQYEEIAAIMGISIETVKSHLYQAREALKLLSRGRHAE